MTDDEHKQEGAEEPIEDLEAPAAVWADVAGGIVCRLPTHGCSNPTCTGQTWCKPGTVQACDLPTCQVTVAKVM